MYKEIKRIKSIVESALRTSHKARNSDKALILMVWSECGLVLDDKQREIWKKLPSSESIRRTRQKLQENGEYLADKPVQKAREINRKNMEVENLRDRGLRIENNCEVCGRHVKDYPNKRHGECK